MADEASSTRPGVQSTSFVRRIPCKRCLNHYAQYPTKNEEANGTQLVACCEDSSASDKCTRCRHGNRPCEKIDKAFIAVAKKLHEHAQDKFKKYQLAGRKALSQMKNRSRARNRRTKKDKVAMKERAREARAVTDLKIRLDMANSLSVIANAAASLASNRWQTVAPYDREVADSYQGVLDDEADEIEYSESDSDEKIEEQA
ncbi:hypothetical protein N5P37_003722 [Trichoderma harzianum]|uniref:Uncharacterized protein n=1 Tax=Trichoderma harzianum CBS 226.95 TaxID=983964 RepID=A0A2T4AVM1_TRIHA|nr:hypothetical protein M431DRAFT_201932 [Trichoderma harzianum CBS 226.95]KAK0764323.1 hypothetical protein N5P37_003722 [Trichoderma harzianum]PTB61018.1 hypothetical protein M431DRAFT_201932 [Trichoderma harzianum CBS 226.95]